MALSTVGRWMAATFYGLIGAFLGFRRVAALPHGCCLSG